VPLDPPVVEPHPYMHHVGAVRYHGSPGCTRCGRQSTLRYRRDPRHTRPGGAGSVLRSDEPAAKCWLTRPGREICPPRRLAMPHRLHRWIGAGVGRGIDIGMSVTSHPKLTDGNGTGPSSSNRRDIHQWFAYQVATHYSLPSCLPTATGASCCTIGRFNRRPHHTYPLLRLGNPSQATKSPRFTSRTSNQHKHPKAATAMK